MKWLDTFENLNITGDSVILVIVPVKAEASKLYLDRGTKEAINKPRIARPMVVAKVGENVTRYRVGDFVFISNDAAQQSMLLVFDEERSWKNPVIINSWLLDTGAKLVYSEEYEKEYTAIIEQIEEKIAADEIRKLEVQSRIK